MPDRRPLWNPIRGITIGHPCPSCFAPPSSCEGSKFFLDGVFMLDKETKARLKKIDNSINHPRRYVYIRERGSRAPWRILLPTNPSPDLLRKVRRLQQKTRGNYASGRSCSICHTSGMWLEILKYVVFGLLKFIFGGCHVS